MFAQKYHLPLALCLTLLTVPGLSAQAKSHNESATPKANQTKTKHDADQEILRNQAKEYERAFSDADAGTLANMWSPDGTFVDAAGQEFQGRAAIEAMFIKLFKEIGKQPLSISIESIRFPAATVAIEEGTTRSTQAGKSAVIGHYTVTHVKKDGVWQMEAATEALEHSSAAMSAPSNSLADMDWLVGKWTTTDASNPIHLNAEWMPNKHFIKCVFKPKDTASDPDELQVLGWNPRSAQINIWNYAADGGFGYGRMIRTAADTWVEKASSLQPDGTICSATYTFKKTGDNTFTWRSTDRIRSGKSMPDTQEITVQRDPN